MSKNLATFSDVKPFTRAAEMPSGVLKDKTRCQSIEAISSQLLIFIG
jgi:hypothetical protein